MALEVYSGIKLVHVLAAVFLVGTIPLEFMLVERLLKRGEKGVIALVLAELEWVENRIAVPAALLLLASGLAMVYGPYGRYELFDAQAMFPAIGLGLWATMIVVFAVVVAGHYKKIRAWAQSDEGGPAPTAAWRGWMSFGTVLALTAVVVMVLRV